MGAPDEAVPADPRASGDSAASQSAQGSHVATLPNGPGAAAILAAGVGSLALGVLALWADMSPSMKHLLDFWDASGPLSGVSTTAVLIWLAAWFVLSKRWAAREVNLPRATAAAFVMLIAGLLLTFPPFMDLLQGK